VLCDVVVLVVEKKWGGVGEGSGKGIGHRARVMCTVVDDNIAVYGGRRTAAPTTTNLAQTWAIQARLRRRAWVAWRRGPMCACSRRCWCCESCTWAACVVQYIPLAHDPPPVFGSFENRRRPSSSPTTRRLRSRNSNDDSA